MPTPVLGTIRQTLRTRDIDEMSAFVSTNMVPSILRPLEPNGLIDYDCCTLVGDGFIAKRSSLSEGLACQPVDSRDMVVVNIALGGTCSLETSAETQMGSTDVIIVSSARTAKRVMFSSGWSEIGIGVSAECVRDRMRAFADIDMGRAFDFVIPVQTSTPLGSALSCFGNLLYGGLEADSLLRSSPIGLRRHKDAFIDLMLYALGADAIRSIAGPRVSVSLSQVRQAEEFMMQSAQEPIGISDVAGHVGVSIRTLQYAFRQHRGTTPLAALQRIRLDGFRNELRTARGGHVNQIAARWGFAHLGRLARQYREAYGETPRETRLRGRERGASAPAGSASDA